MECECLSQAVKHIRLTAAYTNMDLIPVISHCIVELYRRIRRTIPSFHAVFFLKYVFQFCTKTLGIFEITAQLCIHETAFKRPPDHIYTRKMIRVSSRLIVL